MAVGRTKLKDEIVCIFQCDIDGIYKLVDLYSNVVSLVGFVLREAEGEAEVVDICGGGCGEEKAEKERGVVVRHYCYNDQTNLK